MADMNDSDYDRTNQDPYAVHLIEEFEQKYEDIISQEELCTEDFEVVIGNDVELLEVPDGSNKFRWSFYVRTARRGAIKSIKILLHPTFQPPWTEQIVPDTKQDEDGNVFYEWGITRTGWGEFQIRAEINVFTDRENTEEHYLTHQLSLSQKSETTHLLPTPSFQKERRARMEGVVYEEMHGCAADGGMYSPLLEVECNVDARPGYNTMKAHEYEDDPRTLRRKIKLFRAMLENSKNAMAYTGAGISTSSGIDDYATKAKDSKMKLGRKKVRDAFDAVPSLGHRMLTQLWREKHLKHWVQQNHDGLPQKAGYPQHEINEIHGAWYDPSNPVVPMSGSLRSDLFKWMAEWQRKTDFCIAMGTSLCGMNADNCVVKPAQKYRKNGDGCGSVIVGLQRTQYDKICSLRIFARIDTVVALLAEEMKIVIPPLTDYQPDIPAGAQIGPHQFRVPYDTEGNLSNDTHTIWDLREGQKMVVCAGPGEGFSGKMNAETGRDHYVVTTAVIREGDKNHGKGFCKYALGSWWVETATKGLWPTLPIRNVKPQSA